MELALTYRDSLPIGDKGSGYPPTVVALSLHKNPEAFGDDIGNVLAVATQEEVRIYHQKESWEEVLKVEWSFGDEWKFEDIGPVKCLAWDPEFAELAAGDQHGSITVFIHKKEVINGRNYSYFHHLTIALLVLNLSVDIHGKCNPKYDP